MNNDILESEEFNNLMEMACTAATKNEVNIVAAKIKSLIRNHYTPKTVEENETDLSEYILMKISDEYPYMIFESKAKDGTIVAEPIKEMLCFRGSKSECEAEKKRLESLTKGREEKGEFYCDSKRSGHSICFKQCAECAVEQGKKYDVTLDGLNQNLFNKLHELGLIATQDEMSDIICAVEKDKPTPNTENYRAELLSVATAAMNGMLANSIDVNQGSQPRWQLGSVDLAKDACEYADSLLSEVNKRFEK